MKEIKYIIKITYENEDGLKTVKYIKDYNYEPPKRDYCYYFDFEPDSDDNLEYELTDNIKEAKIITDSEYCEEFDIIQEFVSSDSMDFYDMEYIEINNK